jgi:hypothetical protein
MTIDTTPLDEPPTVLADSLSPEGAEVISSTLKSAPQMKGLTSRWLIKILPWVQARGGTYQRNIHDEAHPVEIAGDHIHGALLPRTFVEYDREPPVHRLERVRTVLRVDTSVADLYDEPFDQTEQQLRLVRAWLRERQEHEMVNNPRYGLLANVDPSQAISTISGPPTPDDLDNLIARRRRTKVLLAHPRAIAAFGHECSRRGVTVETIDLDGNAIPAWRGVPLLPCNKLGVDENNRSAILAMRLGEDDEGVIGLHKTGIPDEVEPSLNVRFMGIDDTGQMSYLVTAYFNVLAMVPDAYGILHSVDVGAYPEATPIPSLPVLGAPDLDGEPGE